MELRMLGPVELWADGERLDLGPAKWRMVLAALAVTPGRVVPVDVLVDHVWGADRPGNPTATLYAYVTRLRGVLQPVGVGIVSRGGGYLCDVPPECVDVVRFRRGVAAARELADGSSPDRSAVIALLGEALDNWRGTPLADLSGEWVDRTRQELDRERLAALVSWAEQHAQVGRLAELADGLLAAAAEYPLSEPLAGYLLRSLASAGRRAEALEQFAGLRELLVEQFGEEPGAELQDLHVRLLRRDPELAQARSSGRVVPRQLPSVVRDFVGRSEVLARLDELAEQPGSGAVVLSALSGTAGVGKTATAVYWGHRAAERFPDGQLYVNLRGFDPSGVPVSSGDAVRGFLEGLGVAAEQLPRDLDARTALYRSLIADRRMLVLLDNARDVEQVRPLLPGGSGCLAVVTSRNRLVGLVAEHGAHPVALDVLEPAEAERLLVRRLGPDRVAAEPEAVAALMAYCARLPLALTITAAHAALDPTLPLGKLAAELVDERERLDVLDTDDPVTTIRAVFSWSYAAQPEPVQRMFRLLGLHPGPDLSVPAAASLAGVPIAEAADALDTLCQANLLTELTSGRYAFHDLLRAYATELAEAHDPEPERAAATHRMLDHYLHTAYSADRFLDAQALPITLPTLVAGVDPEDLDGQDSAFAWFEAEADVLLASIRRAVDAGFDNHVWQLAWTLSVFLDRECRLDDRVSIQLAAVEATRRLGDEPAQARALRGLANAYIRVGGYEAADTHLRESIELYGRLGDQVSLAHSYRSLGWLCETQGRSRQALEHAQHALGLYRATGYRPGQANALSSIGWSYALLGEYPEALDRCREALVLHEEHEEWHGQAATWDTLGYSYHQLGDLGQAITCYGHALHFYREVGAHRDEADTLVRLGDTHDAAGDPDSARSAWQAALEIYDEYGVAAAEGVRERLAGRP